MKLLQAGSLEAQTIFAYIICLMVALLITYYFLRFVFSVDKQLKQNDEIIVLLKTIAEKQTR